MINLLPKERKIKTRREYNLRAVAVFLVAFATMLVIGAMMLLPAIVNVYLSRFQAEEDLRVANELLSGPEKRLPEKDVTEFNRKLSLLKPVVVSGPEASILIASLIARRPPLVHVSSFSYLHDQKNTAELFGDAPTRATLLSFVDILRANPFVEKVDSPISNIIPGSKIPFHFSLVIKP